MRAKSPIPGSEGVHGTGLQYRAWKGDQPRLRHCYSGGRRPQTDDVGDNDLLKNSLWKRLRLTEGGYRKRFKSVGIEVGETAEQFVERNDRL